LVGAVALIFQVRSQHLLPVRSVMLGRLDAGQHQVDVAQAMGVSLTTLNKRLRRFHGEGIGGLQGRSSRPRRGNWTPRSPPASSCCAAGEPAASSLSN